MINLYDLTLLLWIDLYRECRKHLLYQDTTNCQILDGYDVWQYCSIIEYQGIVKELIWERDFLGE